jgi:uncharacterized protein
MNRRKFALVWGRKLFFGTGWGLTSLIALNYFQSMILPQTLTGWVFYLTTFLGHYGLLISLLYFGLYYPVAFLVPSYYVTRLWSLLILVAFSALLILDSQIFALYRFHINPLVMDFLLQDKISAILEWNTLAQGLVASLFIIIVVTIWIKGEKTWRWMQTRFGHPIKSWYLVVIFLNLLISQGLYIYAHSVENQEIAQVGRLFPLYPRVSANGFFPHRNLEDKTPGTTKDKFFKYGESSFKCPQKNNKNVVLVLLAGWDNEALSEEATPKIHHYLDHSTRIENHFAASAESEASLFSLLYSLPVNYQKSVEANQTLPVLFQEMKKRDYAFGFFNVPDLFFLQPSHPVAGQFNQMEKDIKAVEAWKSWLSQLKEQKPEDSFFTLLKINHTQPTSLYHADDLVDEVIEELRTKDLLEKTIVIVTADHGSSSEKLKVPFLYFSNLRDETEFKSFSSHYDVVPTLMKEIWGCKNEPQEYSYGESLFKKSDRSWHLISDKEKMTLLDFDKNTIFTLSPKEYEIRDFSGQKISSKVMNEKMLFKVLKDLNRFYGR